MKKLFNYALIGAIALTGSFQLCLDRCDSTNRRNDVHRLQRKR